MSAAEDTPERSSPMRFLADLLFRNWGLKAIAFVLAAVMFVFTRDEVTRVFTVPLRVIEDPERVLLTELPDSIQVQARGPWARVNRLQDYDFGYATLDLEDARPGPLEVDRAGIVMPAGVVLAGIQYDQVDLRFDTVVERELDIKAQVEGVPAPDYEIMGLQVQPEKWMVRGGESAVARVQALVTEPLDIEGAEQDVETSVTLVPPPEGVTLVGAAAEGVSVTVQVVINPLPETRRYTVAVSVPAGLDPTGAVPRTVEVEVSGTRADFRRLDELAVERPVVAEAVRLESESGGLDGEEVVQLRFSWAEAVPADVRPHLSHDQHSQQLRVPTPPPPPPTLDLPDPG